MLNPEFKKFLQNLETEFGEKIDKDFHHFITIFNNLDIYDSFSAEKIEKTKSDFREFKSKNNYYSFGERLLYSLQKRTETGKKTNNERLKIEAELLEKFNKIGITFSKNISLNKFGRKKLQKYLEILEKYEKNFYFFEKTFFSKKISEKNLNKFFGSIYIKNNGKENIFLESLENDDLNVIFGLNFENFFDDLNFEIIDFLDDNSDKNENFIKEEFEKFSKNFVNKKTNNLQELQIIIKNFFEFLNLDEKQKQEVLENKDIVQKIPKTSEKKEILFNNFGNFLEFKNKAELKNFLKRLEKDFPDIKIDYIPSEVSIKNLKNIFNLYFSLKNNWGIKEFFLSDLFFAVNRFSIFNNKESIKKFQNLKKVYNLKTISTRTFFDFDKPSYSGDNDYINIDYDFSLNIIFILENENYNFLVKNSQKIKNKLNLSNKDVSIMDLYSFLDFNKDDLTFDTKIFEEKIYKKFEKYGFLKSEILEILNFSIEEFNEKTELGEKDGIYYLRNLIANFPDSEKDFENIMKKFSYIKNNFFEKDNVDNLKIISHIFELQFQDEKISGKDLDEFLNEIKIFKKYNIKVRDISEFSMYLRNLNHNPELKKYLENADFEKFLKKFLEKYSDLKGNLQSLIFLVEIFKYLENNPNLKKDFENENFEKIEKVFDFLKNKFNINLKNHPSLLNFAFRFGENIDNIKNIFEKMESLGEKVYINDIYFLSIISKEIEADPSKEKFFFDKKYLIDYIGKNIYTKQKFERNTIEKVHNLIESIDEDEKNEFNTKSKEEQLKKIKETYTERPKLETLTLRELQSIYINFQIIQNIDKKEMEKILKFDVNDKTTEIGGEIYVDFDKESKKYKTGFFLIPSISKGDGGYAAAYNKIKSGVDFHLHALEFDEKKYSGASGFGALSSGDFGASYYENSINLVITSLGKKRKGKKLNFDLYWIDNNFDEGKHNYEKFKQVDLGTITLKNN